MPINKHDLRISWLCHGWFRCILLHPGFAVCSRRHFHPSVDAYRFQFRVNRCFDKCSWLAATMLAIVDSDVRSQSARSGDRETRHFVQRIRSAHARVRPRARGNERVCICILFWRAINIYENSQLHREQTRLSTLHTRLVQDWRNLGGIRCRVSRVRERTPRVCEIRDPTGI